MKLQLTIVASGGEPLPPDRPVIVEIRDTSLEDVPAILLQQVNIVVPKAGRTIALPVTIELTAVPDGTTVWVHIDVDRDGRVSKGDYVTVESYPVANVPMFDGTPYRRASCAEASWYSRSSGPPQAAAPERRSITVPHAP